jgi:uncharacterized membrane protein
MENEITHTQPSGMDALHSIPATQSSVNRALAESNFFAVVYPEKDRAEKVIETLQKLPFEKLADLEDAVYVTKDKKGRAQLHHTKHTAKKGSIVGLAVDAILLMPLGGIETDRLAERATTETFISKIANVGIEEAFIRELRAAMKPDSSAMFLLARKVPADEVLPRVSAYGGTILETSLTPDAQRQLQQALKEIQRHKDEEQKQQKERQVH